MKITNHTSTRADRPLCQATDAERFLAPPPPANGRTIGLDCHPDSFTVALFTGTTPHNARLLRTHTFHGLDDLLRWAAAQAASEDLFVLEAGSNSFEVYERLAAINRRSVVLESSYVSRCAKRYADDDRMAASRITKVFLAGGAPAVWVPDALARERRELLHAYQDAVRAHVSALNSLKSYLNQSGVRPGRSLALHLPHLQTQILQSHPWSPLQVELLTDHFTRIQFEHGRRDRLRRLIADAVTSEPLMLRTMKLLGIGIINAFALLAVIGDIRRFATPSKLVAYLGLNPGQKTSGKLKALKIGVGKRGRGDLRALLLQAAHTILRRGRMTELGQWGWKLFARKGNRNVAAAAVARKLLVQVWHLLSGNPPIAKEQPATVRAKLQRLAIILGKARRAQLQWPATLDQCVDYLYSQLYPEAPPQSS